MKLTKEQRRRAVSPTLEEFREDLQCTYEYSIANDTRRGKRLYYRVTINDGNGASLRWFVMVNGIETECDGFAQATRRYWEA